MLCMVIGVLLYFIAWLVFWWIVNGIVAYFYPPYGSVVTMPSVAQLATVCFALLSLPVVIIAGGYKGWNYAVPPQGERNTDL